MADRRTSDATLIAALRILVREIKSKDGVANATIAEAADRLETLVDERRWVSVGERLPPVGPDEKVLVAWRYEDEPNESLVVSEAWHVRLGLFLDKEEFEFPGVKFWQPLPTEPEKP